jgi:radical SAM superfamily enzyme YgiQ (UPF0313 family)
MRCLLINPFCPISEGATPPLGISFLAAVLEKAGVEVKILDLTVYPYSKQTFSEFLNDFNPEIVGITAVTMTFNGAIRTIQAVKEINPTILTVMGGPHVTFCAVETLVKYPALDLIVIGEGEETLVELTAEYSANKNWSKVKGLAFRNGGKIIINEKRDYLDVNTLPLPARHLLPLGRYRALHTPISITTSRGCPFRCIFCVGRKMVGAKVRYRDPIVVVNEFEMLAKMDFPQINVSDDLFTAKKSHCIDICNEILKRKLSITWSSFSRVDTVTPDLLEKMREAGCKTISFGVETANSEILKTIKKGISIEKVEKALSMCRDAGIQSHVSFIMGLPGESPDTIRETQAFGKTIERLGGFYGFHMLAPFPGTAVRENNEEYDLKILTDDWDQYHANWAITETSKIEKKEMNAITEEWDTETQKALNEIRIKMELGTATAHEAWQLINLDRFLFLYQMMMDSTIETFGTWSDDSLSLNADDALRELAKRIHKQLNQPEVKALEILKYAYDRGSIFLNQEGREVKWEWKNYL